MQYIKGRGFKKHQPVRPRNDGDGDDDGYDDDYDVFEGNGDVHNDDTSSTDGPRSTKLSAPSQPSASARPVLCNSNFFSVEERGLNMNTEIQ